MNDPLGLVSNAQRLQPPVAPNAPNGPGRMKSEGPAFTEVLRAEIERVDEMQRDAKESVEDLMTGERTDVENVMTATKKADLAFRSLMSVRNKVLEAYDELKQVRV